MFLSADTLTYLMGLGLQGDKLVELVRRLDADAQAVAPVPDATREKKRERDRERYQRRIHGETAGELAGETEAESTAKPLAESGGQDARAPTYTGGENNLSRLVDKPNLTTPNDVGVPDLDWPEGDKPSRAYLDQLEAVLLDAVGPALASAAVAPKVKVLGPILALGRTGQGPPCDLQADVLPTIRARAAKAAPRSVKSWDFFRDACLEARDRRLSGAGAMGLVVALPRGQGPPRLTEQIGAEHAESKRIALEKLGAQNG